MNVHFVIIDDDKDICETIRYQIENIAYEKDIDTELFLFRTIQKAGDIKKFSPLFVADPVCYIVDYNLHADKNGIDIIRQIDEKTATVILNTGNAYDLNDEEKQLLDTKKIPVCEKIKYHELEEQINRFLGAVA